MAIEVDVRSVLIQDEAHGNGRESLVTAKGVTRRYGVEGDICVKALRGCLARRREREAHRDHGPVGLGQVDPHAHPRGARPAERG